VLVEGGDGTGYLLGGSTGADVEEMDGFVSVELKG